MGRRRLVGLALVVLLAAASISFNARRTFEVVDGAGAPLDPIYIAYSRIGSRPNLAHPVSYQAAPLALARSDRAGRVVIPAAFHVHRPFPLETHPSLWVEMVYVPRMHNSWGQFNKGAPSRAGIFVIDATLNRATVSDLADKPELWEGTLRNLSSIINRLASRAPERAPLRQTDPATAALTVELIGHFRQEYDAFLARYRDVARVKPEMPAHMRGSSEEEQKRWLEFIEADLAHEPRWGILITRLFGDEVKLFTQYEAELR